MEVTQPLVARAAMLIRRPALDCYEAFIDPAIAGERAIFPTAADLARLETVRDFDPALRRTLSRLWTEIKVR